MADSHTASLETALRQYIEPHLKQDLVSAKAIKTLQVDAGRATISVQLGFPCRSSWDGIKQGLSAAALTVEAITEAEVDISCKIVEHTVQHGVERISGVKNIIAVASGKGGVGKSTTAVNMALALAAEGAVVGLLDADIYGPSQPRMLGIAGQPESTDGKSLEPMVGFGIQAMSIGFLIDEQTPMIWRGPMVTQALEQLLRDTRWREVDYLIIDLPPGTGDIQLTLSQKVPVSGAVIVTTPQEIALLDARKGLKMFEKVSVPILGVVENMSTHICSKCGHEESIFGAGGGAKMADENAVDLLGSLPLDLRIREQADGGQPTVVADPDGVIAQNYRLIACRTAAKLSQQARDFSAKFPKIVIENT